MLKIAAIVLAAGLSTRMGQQKLLLPWGSKTVIEHIVNTILESGLAPIVVVTGKRDKKLNSILNRLDITRVVNTEYANGSMVTTLKKGISVIQDTPLSAFMVFLGDQPSLQIDTIRKLIATYKGTNSEIVVPSYQYHQGHPWLIDRKLWQEIMRLSTQDTLIKFLAQYKKSTQYVLVDSPTILEDMDTPEEFQRIRPV
jgi:molybdenum cofactor cytidylyltransferase